MKIEGITWLCLAAKFKSKAWLQDLRLSGFNKFVEYTLGERVNGIKTSINGTQQPLRPPWSIVLDYEFKLRKEAFKHVIRGKGTLKEALEEVVKDSELKKAYFVTPLTLASHKQPNKYQRTGGKGNQGHPQGGNVSSFGKGKHSKGKNHKKGKGKGGFKGDTALVSQTQMDVTSAMPSTRRDAQASAAEFTAAESVDVLDNTVHVNITCMPRTEPSRLRRHPQEDRSD